MKPDIGQCLRSRPPEASLVTKLLLVLSVASTYVPKLSPRRLLLVFSLNTSECRTDAGISLAESTSVCATDAGWRTGVIALGLSNFRDLIGVEIERGRHGGHPARSAMVRPAQNSGSAATARRSVCPTAGPVLATAGEGFRVS